ncbi:MAG: osmosensitive channel signal transduction histidine kinase [Myxococcales bacterium]|nr:osmosensitive channel signal transduction histidine kinase [Myxococcales bacterium]
MPDSDNRPDPDVLLAQARAEAPGPRRARLKIFFGASPGVGKTFAMLESARRLVADGVDVVVGVVETHGRPETSALLTGLEILPRKKISYRSIEIEELDTDAALARKPSVILVDELAHTNAPGVRHPKRWQDVTDLLEAGIDVHTTLNVQHVESVVDTVAQITGVRVRETVPDAILERADEIELIDLSPEELLARLGEGKVYIPEQARHAVDNFFKRGNLLALRELALRRTAERVDVDVQAYRREQRIGALWPTSERILVCIGPSPGSERLVRAASRIAESIRAPWHAVHIDVTGAPPLRPEDRDRVDAHLLLAESLGAAVVRLAGSSVSSALLAFAREHNVSRIVAGKPTHSRWRDRLRGSLLDALIRGSGEVEIHLIAPHEELPPRATTPRPNVPNRWTAYTPGMIAVAGATMIGVIAGGRLSLPDDVMLFLFAIMLAALGGRGPGIAAAALAVAAYDFFFIEPHYTFAVADLRNLMTFAVMFTVGTAMGSLVARLRHAETASRQRERSTAALLAFTEQSASATDIADVAAAVVAHVEDVLAAPTSVLIPAADGTLSAVAGLEPLAAKEIAVARWAQEHRRPAGRGTDTLPQARLLAVPLTVGEDSAGVVAVQIERARRRIDLEGRNLLEAIARQAGVAIARLRLAGEARAAALRVQAEELRNSLLSTVSHDLRTPLAIITGMATALRESATSLSADQIESLDTIVDEARRLGKILTNLLSITRVESGAEVKREWVPVEELVGSALERTEAALANRDIKIEIEPDVGVLVDPILTEQLFLNLLENAAKHTPARSPIEIRARRDAGGVTIEISDRGPGVPAGADKQVFEKFFRGPETRTAGAGLGLAVCRGIVIAHGGRIEALPRDGGGATFRVWLPGGEAPEMAPSREAELPAAAAP